MNAMANAEEPKTAALTHKLFSKPSKVTNQLPATVPSSAIRNPLVETKAFAATSASDLTVEGRIANFAGPKNAEADATAAITTQTAQKPCPAASGSSATSPARTQSLITIKDFRSTRSTITPDNML